MKPLTIKSRSDIQSLHQSGKLVSEIFAELESEIVEGVKLEELDKLATEMIISAGGTPAYLGFEAEFAECPFPATLCTSVNDEICHGIPTKRHLTNGDIVSIDVGLYLNGWAGDSCRTFTVGKVSHDTLLLINAALECLEAGVSEVVPGRKLGNIGAAIQEVAMGYNFHVVKPFTGHGLGHNIHEEPIIFHWGVRDEGLEIREGMVFTIEPMINVGSEDFRILDNGWTAVTSDGKLSAQFEYSVAVNKGGCEVLTPILG